MIRQCRLVHSRTVTQGERSAAGWWAKAPTDRVVCLDGAAAELLRLSLDPLPPGAPAVVVCRPPRCGLLAEQVAALLDDLEQAAAGLFPRWLPGADGIAGPQGAGVAAVRALALATAATTPHFGPFLAGLAERALYVDSEPERFGRGGGTSGFAPAVRAAGLARVFAASYGRPTAALLIELPEDLSAPAERTLVSSVEWIAHHGGWGVWLTGAALRVVDRIDSHQIELPMEIAHLAGAVGPWIPDALDVLGTSSASDAPVTPDSAAAPGTPDAAQPPPHSHAEAEPDDTSVRCPAIAGLPRADSPAELKLESALRRHPWAAGRVWNATYQPDPLAPAYRLDLWWETERCVVEIDGPEHRSAAHFAADRRRDVRLQLAGNAVLRFTNTQVLADVSTVVSQIERFIRSRRPRVLEDRPHAD